MAYIGRDIQYGTFTKQSLTPDGSTVTFTLDQGVADATNLLLSIGGVIQEPNVAYTASGTTLTLTSAPAAGIIVYLIYLGKELAIPTATSNLNYQVGTGDGSSSSPMGTLDRTAPTPQSIMVMLNGVTQVPGTDYTVNDTALTFTTPPASGVDILVYFLGVAGNIGTPSDGTVGTVQLADNAVTDGKIVGMSSSKLSGALPAIDGSALTNMPAELPAAGSSGNLLTSDGASWTSAAAPADELPAAGSSGNVLTSDGTNWASTAPAGGGGGGLQSLQVFTTPGSFTWTKPAGITKIKVIVTGAGGGGGSTYYHGYPAAGGGSGGTVIKFIDVSGISSVSLTVGVKGGGGANAGNGQPGAGGSSSSFGSHCYATGGMGGKDRGNLLNQTHSFGGQGYDGDINLKGNSGQVGDKPDSDGISGAGGASFWGGAPTGQKYDYYPASGTGVHGAGGSGATGTGYDGGPGIIVVEEYA